MGWGRIAARSLLLTGDLIMLLAFSAAGRREHRLPVDAAGILETGLPFITAWLVVAVLLGGYRESAYGDVRTAAAAALMLCVLAVPLGWGVRGLYLGSGIPATFAAVSFTTLMGLLVSWRTGFAWWYSRQRRGVR